MIKGRCECGQVAFELPKVRETVTVCHCSQCRRTSGHLWASTYAPFDSLTLTKDEGLVWYASSDFAKRGFCRHCGSSLFYRTNEESGIAIAAGALDAPTNMHIGKHIFVADHGDYYEIEGDAPKIDKV